jgi:fucose permease
MMRLNLLWAVGACAGPWLALGGQALKAGARTVRPLHILVGLAAFFVAFALWVSLAIKTLEPDTAEPVPDSVSSRTATRWPLAQIPLALLILVFCATGVESATGGWLAAYAQRLGETAKTTIGAATAFWVGLLSSRLINSLRVLARLSERIVLPMGAGLAAIGLAILVAWPGAVASLFAALMVGLGIGPIYPLLLAIVLRKRETRGVFVIAGAGASALPLATGALSGWTHSLSAGLCVPLAVAAMMTVLSTSLKISPTTRPTER